jgi:rare lipoprotein A
MVLLNLYFFIPVKVWAVDKIADENVFSIKIGEDTIKKGYTVRVFEDKFSLAIFPDVLQSSTSIEFKNISKLDSDKIFPEEQTGWARTTDIFQYDIIQKESYSSKKLFGIEIGFDSEDVDNKKIFFFNEIKNSWQSLPTKIDWQKNKAKTEILFSYAKLALFEKPEAGKGLASWYNQKKYIGVHGDYVASTQYPRGTKLKVTNLKNNKSVIVKVNDYGPEKWTGRIIDLEVSAFKKIAWKGTGVINVSVEPI